MKEWNIIHLRNATPIEQQDPKVVEKCMVAYNAIKSKRAEIIEATLSVEGLLDQVILDVLVGRDASKRTLNAELILAAEFCTSFQKWKILGHLMSESPSYFEKISQEEGKSLRKDIHELIKDRNRFAHGDLFVNVADSYAVDLRYYENGKKYLRITDQILSDSLSRAKRSREALWKLHNNFGTDLQTAVI